MDKLRIRGRNRLNGTVRIGGAKNAALPVLIASLLTDEPCVFTRVPGLQDINTVLDLLVHLGVRSSGVSAGQVTLQADGIKSQIAPYDLVRKMRASVVVLGPLLARFGHAKVSMPGGCAIGARPIDFHLKGLEALGAEIELEEGYVIAKAKRLRGARVVFDFPSVGATENVMMAAALADGESRLENCAREPEITDLATVLRSMGAQIEGDGSATIRIQGKKSLKGATHQIMGDRIEAGTYLAAAFITGGKVRVEGIDPTCLDAVIAKFEQAGAAIKREAQAIELSGVSRPKAVDIATAPYPLFPTDMQAQYMALMTVADGASAITETIFENRFMHVAELRRLGAEITVSGNTAVVKGVASLNGAPLMATDLRASASLVLAALAAAGETVISRIYHLDRGYERMEEKLAAIGADIERTK